MLDNNFLHMSLVTENEKTNDCCNCEMILVASESMFIFSLTPVKSYRRMSTFGN